MNMKHIRLISRVIWLTLAVAVMPFIIMIALPLNANKMRRLKETGKRTEAIVVNSWVLPMPDGRYKGRITYQFTDASGRTMKTTVGSPDKLRMNDTLTVVYLPDNPSVNCPETAIEDLLKSRDMLIRLLKS
jgi:hypothetical protein